MSPASVSAKIRVMVGDPTLKISIRSTSVWYVNQAYATTYSLERASVGKQVVMRANQSRLEYAALNRCFRVVGDEDPVLAELKRLRPPNANPLDECCLSSAKWPLRIPTWPFQ